MAIPQHTTLRNSLNAEGKPGVSKNVNYVTFGALTGPTSTPQLAPGFALLAEYFRSIKEIKPLAAG